MNIEECLTFLNQLDEGCSDDGESSDLNFLISSESEILEHISDFSEDSDFPHKNTLGVSRNRYVPDGMQLRILDESSYR